jgi:hypothetical protein
MYELTKIGKVFTSKFVGTGRGPRLIKKEFTGLLSHRGYETLVQIFDKLGVAVRPMAGGVTELKCYIVNMN